MLGQLETGTLFGRDFRVLRPLRAGGMGAVYEVVLVARSAVHRGEGRDHFRGCDDAGSGEHAGSKKISRRQDPLPGRFREP